jgi:CRP-like cAMP-binding protein
MIAAGEQLPVSPEASTPQVPSEVGTSGRMIAVNLQNLPLFMGLDSATLGSIASVLLFRNFEKGAYVLHKGGQGEHMLFVLTGRLQVVDLTEDGREIGLSFLRPGDYFGELSIIDGLPRSASVIACESALVGLLPKQQAQTLIYRHPLIAERILKRMAASIRTASTYRAILSLPNAFQRVFTLLNQLATKTPCGMTLIEKMPTQQEIAIMVNTSRETVSRALNTLIHEGIVEKDSRRLVILNPLGLKKATLGYDMGNPSGD